jgi:hypothetical protein
MLFLRFAPWMKLEDKGSRNTGRITPAMLHRMRRL